MKCAIIVPVYNEAAALPVLLTRLHPLQSTDTEVILVDGGSTDNSVELIQSAGFQVVQSARGRAQQMNAGASCARGEQLLFLHADTQLPAGAMHQIETALADHPHAWGRFDVAISGKPAMLRVIARLINLRSRLSGIATGDQALFMQRSAFDAVGGFPDQPLMEDIEICRRLKRLCAPCCLKAQVITSGRRWETRGVWRTIFLMWYLRLAYWLGVDPEKLVRMYR